MGEKVLKAVNPGQQFTKIVYDKMTSFLGDKKKDLALKGTDVQSVVLCLGLQGSGKTTTAAKLANKVKKYKGIYGKQGYIMAIEECIRENSKISDYLMRKMQEVAEMFSEEYNYLAELEASQLIGIEAGKIEGRREGRIEGRREGMMEGKIEGRMEEKLEMASTMKKKGFETAMIMELTNLSREDIERL